MSPRSSDQSLPNQPMARMPSLPLRRISAENSSRSGNPAPLTKYCPGDAATQPAFPVQATDTTGCGEAFHGAYAASLARAVLRLHNDAALYEKLSHASAAALARLPQAVSWDDVLTRFLYGGLEDSKWLQDNSLRSGKYHDWVARYWPSLLVRVRTAGVG